MYYVLARFLKKNSNSDGPIITKLCAYCGEPATGTCPECGQIDLCDTCINNHNCTYVLCGAGPEYCQELVPINTAACKKCGKQYCGLHEAAYLTDAADGGNICFACE